MLRRAFDDNGALASGGVAISGDVHTNKGAEIRMIRMLISRIFLIVSLEYTCTMYVSPL